MQLIYNLIQPHHQLFQLQLIFSPVQHCHRLGALILDSVGQLHMLAQKKNVNCVYVPKKELSGKKVVCHTLISRARNYDMLQDDMLQDTINYKSNGIYNIITYTTPRISILEVECHIFMFFLLGAIFQNLSMGTQTQSHTPQSLE